MENSGDTIPITAEREITHPFYTGVAGYFVHIFSVQRRLAHGNVKGLRIITLFLFCSI